MLRHLPDLPQAPVRPMQDVILLGLIELAFMTVYILGYYNLHCVGGKKEDCEDSRRVNRVNHHNREYFFVRSPDTIIRYQGIRDNDMNFA